MHKRFLALCSWTWNGVKLSDFIILVVLIFGLLVLINQAVLARHTQKYLHPVSIDIVVPNLDPEVASQIKVSDMIVDQQGRSCFEILEKIERPAEHPVIDSAGQIVVAQHPKLISIFLTIRSLEPLEFENGIKYNWQVIKIGGSLIWETRYCRFVGLIRKID